MPTGYSILFRLKMMRFEMEKINSMLSRSGFELSIVCYKAISTLMWSLSKNLTFAKGSCI